MTPVRFLRMLVYLRPSQPLWRLWYRFRLPLFHLPAYARLLRRGEAPPPAVLPQPLHPGDAEAGRRILAGSIRQLGAEVPFGRCPDWHPAGRTPLWRFTLNYFEWLADLRAVGGEEPRERARVLVRHWWEAHRDRLDSEGWHPYPLSLRIAAWLGHGSWLLDGAADDFRRLFAEALQAQVRHLARVVERDVGGNHLIKNIKALILAGIALPGRDRELEKSLADLRHRLGRQILADGCHYERSPSYHVQVLTDLVELRQALPSSPDWLEQTIVRMAGAYACLRHGDGGLTQFNDGDEGDPALLAALDAALDPLPPPGNLPAAGYYRLERAGMLAVLDAGLCCPDDLPAHAHADTLSFEFSHGKHRIIVNSGTYGYQEPQWRLRLRGTAAASTVCVDGLDSAEVFGVFRLGRRPRRVEAMPVLGGVEAQHDGWRHLGVVHRRRLILDDDGLCGTDMLEGVVGRTIQANFHLHPTVLAEARNGGFILACAGARWRFEAEGGATALDTDVYAPRFGVLVETRRITVTTVASGDLRLNWRLTKIP